MNHVLHFEEYRRQFFIDISGIDYITHRHVDLEIWRLLCRKKTTITTTDIQTDYFTPTAHVLEVILPDGTPIAKLFMLYASVYMHMLTLYYVRTE